MTVSIRFTVRNCCRFVPANPLARFFVMTSSPGSGAIRSSICTSGVPTASFSTGILRTHRPMSDGLDGSVTS